MLIKFSVIAALAASFSSAEASCAIYQQWVSAPLRADTGLHDIPGVNLLFRATAATKTVELLGFQQNNGNLPLITLGKTTCTDKVNCEVSFNWQTLATGFPNVQPRARAVWNFGANDVRPYTPSIINKVINGFTGALSWLINTLAVPGVGQMIDNVGFLSGGCVQIYTPPAPVLKQVYSCSTTTPYSAPNLITTDSSNYYKTFFSIKSSAAATATFRKIGLATGSDALGSNFVTLLAASLSQFPVQSSTR